MNSTIVLNTDCHYPILVVKVKTPWLKDASLGRFAASVLAGVAGFEFFFANVPSVNRYDRLRSRVFGLVLVGDVVRQVHGVVQYRVSRIAPRRCVLCLRPFGKHTPPCLRP